ncbi:hypothetical protein B0T26DRAFT_333724 [Lasiosphaeria miniovina]|uniref:C2H2-type domain-containing protein n=1 Tax=Lasiosphaeria miniovina TaxID=1954250 RepID=A0AA40AMM0_9PEZI|nr:uncharacterized protein B0T26DRAFT_333724 [Lasiosphaeria miniovina]KAK0718599.1 hypothetical protein B0T26DRAFT_333724 [Lasiosphaeria miniovina]
MVDTPQINPKRAKRSEKSEKTDETIDWPCPYRKRNPLRFNLNDHPSCALHPFQDIKTHIRDFHQLGDRHRCPRCKKVLLDSRQYDAHLQLPIEQMCALSSETPPRDFEDGITVDLDTLLARVSSYEPWATQLRGGRSAGVVHQWALLWAALFPEDIRVPSLRRFLFFKSTKAKKRALSSTLGATSDFHS